MKVALVRLQVRHRHVLNGNCVMGCIGNDGIAVPVIMGRRQKRIDICKDSFVDLDDARCGREVSNRDPDQNWARRRMCPDLRYRSCCLRP
jgi:hypothetical protein